MGYHVIDISEGKLRHEYVEYHEELAFIDFINNDTVIYQGEEHWKPFKVSDSEKYKNFAKKGFRAGIQAQELFKEQAIQNGYILEELNQDQKSFKAYTRNSRNISIKRGDFLIRNFGNIEVDVKCHGFKSKDSEAFFYFKCEDWEKHMNMQKFTNTPILLAVYENDDGTPIEDIYIYMLAVTESIKSKLEFRFIKAIGECFQIPLELTEKGFKLINQTFENISGKAGVLGTLQQTSAEFPKAYMPWSLEDIELLNKLMDKKSSISEMSTIKRRKVTSASTNAPECILPVSSDLYRSPTHSESFSSPSNLCASGLCLSNCNLL